MWSRDACQVNEGGGPIQMGHQGSRGADELGRSNKSDQGIACSGHIFGSGANLTRAGSCWGGGVFSEDRSAEG